MPKQGAAVVIKGGSVRLMNRMSMELISKRGVRHQTQLTICKDILYRSGYNAEKSHQYHQ